MKLDESGLVFEPGDGVETEVTGTVFTLADYVPKAPHEGVCDACALARMPKACRLARSRAARPGGCETRSPFPHYERKTV